MNSKVRIVSDGTPAGTKVFAGDAEVANISKIEWKLDANDGFAKAIVTIDLVEIDVVVEVEV